MAVSASAFSGEGLAFPASIGRRLEPLSSVGVRGDKNPNRSYEVALLCTEESSAWNSGVSTVCVLPSVLLWVTVEYIMPVRFGSKIEILKIW